jgi:hypothetical protein
LEEKELQFEAVVKEYLTTAADGKRYRTMHHSLNMILAVGYRVRSPRETLLRQWATARRRTAQRRFRRRKEFGQLAEMAHFSFLKLAEHLC